MKIVERNRILTPFSSFDELDYIYFKVNIFGNERIDKIKEDIICTFSNKYWAGKTSPYTIEIVLNGVSKGNVVDELMKSFHLKKEEVVIFGDGENDISMMEKGTGVCMANALESVKKRVSFQTLSNDENGIVYMLKKWVE